ncbi:34080_t:CDS:2, partial [Gigaspora margarita]
MEIETNPISEDTSKHTRPVVTNNKDRNAKERIELEESYTLWDLPLNFNNTQIRLLIKRYSKVLSINWIFDSFKKRAIVKIAIKNERSKQILDDSWSLSIDRKLTRITQEENEKEVLVNRRKHKLILEEEDMYKNRRNPSPDSDKEKKVVNRFSKSISKLNQKNTLYEKKITCSYYNKENESGKNTKYKNYYDEDKRKEGHNVKRSRYIESLDEKLQIIFQRLDKIEANRLRDGDKKANYKTFSQNKEKEKKHCMKKKKKVYSEAKLIDKNPIVEDKIEGALDSIWEALEKDILETAMKHIPKKKICKTKVTRDGKKRPRLDKLIIELGRWKKVPDRDRKHRQKMGKQGHKGLERLELEELMIRKYKKNRLENRENLVFYTDSSLVRTSTEKRGMDRMGASWVQVGLDKEEILNTGYV